MRLERVEDRAVALGEVATLGSVEMERVRAVRLRADGEVEGVLAGERSHPLVVEARPLEGTPSTEVRDAKRSDIAFQGRLANRVDLGELCPESGRQVLVVHRVISQALGGEHEALPLVVELRVTDPVGAHERAELGEKLRSDLLIPTVALGIGNEPK